MSLKADCIDIVSEPANYIEGIVDYYRRRIGTHDRPWSSSIWPEIISPKKLSISTLKCIDDTDSCNIIDDIIHDNRIRSTTTRPRVLPESSAVVAIHSECHLRGTKKDRSIDHSKGRYESTCFKCKVWKFVAMDERPILCIQQIHCTGRIRIGIYILICNKVNNPIRYVKLVNTL